MNPLRRNLASTAVISTVATLGVLVARASGADAPAFIGTLTSDAGTDPGGPPGRYTIENASTPPPDAAFASAAVSGDDPNPGPSVLDVKTGLTWQQYSVYEVSLANAQTYCGDLTTGGSAPWRVPAINELMTLIDFAQTTPPYQDQTAFPPDVPTPQCGTDCLYDEYWSTTPVIGASGNVWEINFWNSGAVEQYREVVSDPVAAAVLRVRCVHS